jgi:hypothetical protein
MWNQITNNIKTTDSHLQLNMDSKNLYGFFAVNIELTNTKSIKVSLLKT